MPGSGTIELPASHPLRLFTVDEAAEILGYNPKTLHRWCQHDRVPHHNILGAGRRFSYADLEQILRAGERGPR